MSIIYFIIAIGVLILVHEVGHYLLALRNGIRVERFSIGFGPKIVGFKRGETEYQVSPIPLGGYIKMTGEDPSEENVADEKSFAKKSTWARMRVVAAGPVMNLVLAFVIMPVVFFIGRMEPAFLSERPVLMDVKKSSPAMEAGLVKGDLIKEINGKSVSDWRDVLNTIILSGGQTLELRLEHDGAYETKRLSVATMPEMSGGYAGFEPILFLGNEAVADHIVKGGPAEKGGLKAGDKVLSVNGVAVEGWTDMAEEVNKAGGIRVSFEVERDGKKMSLWVEPEFSKDYNRWVIGIKKDRRSDDIPMVKRRYGLIGAVKEGAKECYTLLGLTMQVLKKLFTLQLSYKALGGPIQIASISIAAAKVGIAEFIYFMAFLSLQLGILNLLPIPVLDGGHILFLGVETVIRRPLSVRVRGIAQYVGLTLILSLLFLVTINDLESVWGIKGIIQKWFTR